MFNLDATVEKSKAKNMKDYLMKLNAKLVKQIKVKLFQKNKNVKLAKHKKEKKVIIGKIMLE